MVKRLHKVYLLIPIVILSSLFALTVGCNLQNSILEDTKWFLRSYGEQNNMQAIIKDTDITAIFSSDKDKLSGSAGCNTYFADYDISGNTLSVTGMAYTEMACISPEGIMEQEQDFLSLLANAQSFEVANTTLTIICVDGMKLNFTSATG